METDANVPRFDNVARSSVVDLYNVARSSVVDLKDLSLWKYFSAELTRGYLLEHDEARYALKRQRVYTFIRIPKELEKVHKFNSCTCTLYIMQARNLTDALEVIYHNDLGPIL